jgi:hypothetical protein
LGIEIQRVGVRPFKRYVARVTPPDGAWETARPAWAWTIKRRLYADGNHLQDVAQAFQEADAERGR